MAKRYVVRTAQGDAKFIMPEELAIKAIAEYRGEWKTINGKSAYKMLDGGTITTDRPVNMGGGIELFIWPGDWIFIEN